MKMIIAGVWACGVIATVDYVQTKSNASTAKSATVASESKMVTMKTREINVPKIENGSIKGYIVTQMSYNLNAAFTDKTSMVDSIVSDSIFKFIYAYTEFDLDRLQAFDINKLTDFVKKDVNARLSSSVIASVGIAEFTFVPASDAKSKPAPTLESRK